MTRIAPLGGGGLQVILSQWVFVKMISRYREVQLAVALCRFYVSAGFVSVSLLPVHNVALLLVIEPVPVRKLERTMPAYLFFFFPRKPCTF